MSGYAVSKPGVVFNKLLIWLNLSGLTCVYYTSNTGTHAETR